MTNQLYYHGSAVPGIKSLEPRSKLHNNIAKDVLYLTSSAPYALVYIWSEEKDTSVNKDYCMHKPKRLAFLNGILNRLGIWDESDSFGSLSRVGVKYFVGTGSMFLCPLFMLELRRFGS